MNKHQRFSKILTRYLPIDFVPDVVRLLVEYPVVFKIVKPRKTKLGDFRAKNSSGKMQITINADLNPYNFLITTLHEFAHLQTYMKHKHLVAPHGPEWQNHFKALLLPIIESGNLPKEIESVLKKSIVNLKASSCTDYDLNRVMMKFDTKDDSLVLLEELDFNSAFEINGKQFIKGELRRTRFLCEEKPTGKKYLVNHLAKVNKL